MSYKKIVISEFGSPEVLKSVTESELPEPGPNEVRIKMEAVSATFSDTLVRKGLYPGLGKKPPLTPGYDIVGVIDKTGNELSEFKVGQRVASLIVTGGYTEYLCLPANKLVQVPDEIDPVEAVSLVLSYLSAYQMLVRKAKVKKGQTILVHGAGGAVGSAFLQLGKHYGLKVFGTGSEGKRKTIEKEGAVFINYKEEDFEKRIQKETENGVDAVFDAIGGDHFRRSFNCLKKRGTLVAYGFYNQGVGKKEGSVPVDFVRILLWHIFPNGRKSFFYRIKNDKWFEEDMKELLLLVSWKKIKPVIDKVLTLSEVASVHKLIENAEVNGRIVLTP